MKEVVKGTKNKANELLKEIRQSKLITLSVLLLIITLSVTGCRQADKVTYNISKEADNFNVLRRFAVINTRTDKVEFEMIGAFSLNVESEKKVSVVVEKEDGTYLKHIIGLNQDSIYVVEDLGGAKVNNYKYEINYVPQSIIPFTVTESK